jgi:hypothetical protein
MTARLASLACLAALGCGGSASVSATATIHDDLGAPASALAACAPADQAIVAANLAIISDLRESYHEMVVCGALALGFEIAIANVIIDAVTGKGGPPELVYRGNGTFATGNGMMEMHVGLADGGLIPWNPLDPQSYLAGLTIDASGAVGAAARGGSVWSMLGHAATNLDVRFNARGPAFELLGLTDAEARSGKLHIDATKIANAIASRIVVSDKIDVRNGQGATTIHYLLDGAPTPIKDALANKTIPMTLTSVAATRPDTGQTIKITEWTMAFKGDGSKTLDGTIGFDVTGGAFPYRAKFTYPHRMEPDIVLSCMQ